MFEQDVKRIRRNTIISKIETDFLAKIGNRKLICYGASNNWTEINKIIDISDLVEFCVDGDSNKWGEDYYGKKIESPEKINSVDKDKYAVVVLSAAYDEISKVLDAMGLEENVHYYNICQYLGTLNDGAIEEINLFLHFLDTVPSEIRSKVVDKEKEKNRIGIVLLMETLNYGITYVPYLAALFLLLKWRGYNVKLIVEHLHWDADLIAYEGACADYDEIRDVVIRKLEKLVPQEDIMYIEPVEDRECSEEDKAECRWIAEYSAKWSKWYNLGKVQCISEEELQKEYEGIFVRNLPYIDAFFEENHFDTINAITALHKMAGIYNYVGKKRGIRVSSQDGSNGNTLISANGPASHFGDIPFLFRGTWESLFNQDDIIVRAKEIWKRRRGFTITIDADTDLQEYEKTTVKKGYMCVNYQTKQSEIEQEYDVVIPLNLAYDGAMIGVNSIFENYLEWLEKTIDYVINTLKRSIMIREHPVVKLLPNYMQSCELHAIYPELLDLYNGNSLFRYVKSNEDINIYEYMEHCKVVIPWTSITGVEAGIMKKNILVHTNVYYENTSFVLRAHSQQEYFQILKECVLGKEWLVSDEQVAFNEALRYFYYSMHMHLVTDFSIYNSDLWNGKVEDFMELLETEGVEEIIHIVAEGIPSPYLIEKQYRRKSRKGD